MAYEHLCRVFWQTTGTSLAKFSPQTVKTKLMVKFDFIFKRAGKVNLHDISYDPKKALKLDKFTLQNILYRNESLLD